MSAAAPCPAGGLPDEGLIHRALFSAYPDALLLVDAQGTIVLANQAAVSLLGYEMNELCGLAVDALVPDAIRPRHAAYRAAYAANPRPRPMGTQMELVAKRRDGSEVMVEIALSPLQDAGLPYVVAAIRGIGAYPRVRQALQRARYSECVAQVGRLAVDTRDPQVLLQQVPAAAADTLHAEVSVVFLLEADGQTLRVGGGVGQVPEEALGCRVPNRLDTPAGYVLAQGRPVIIEDYRRETRFTVPASYLAQGVTSALAVPLSDRGSVVGVLTVRTRQQRSFGDDEIRFLQSLSNLLASSVQRAQTEEALNHAQRLESVGQLTGGIAHDFNNLLTIIQGNLQVLDEHPAVVGDEYAQQLVSAATRAARRGAELTGKLLAFSRRQMLTPSEVDVGALVVSLADMLQRTLDQRIDIRLDVAPDCPPCIADAGQLESALLNVAINARDAMPDGGQLIFSCRPCEVLPPAVQAELAAHGPSHGHVAIAITDTGVGMSEAVLERAFEPFFTTKEAGRGTGLGLSTVYGFAKQSRGAVALESAPGQGTTVTLYIPQPASRAPQALHPAASRADGLQGIRVLLVEDEPAVKDVVLSFLHTLGCTVVACGSGEEAMLKLIDPAEPAELLLTDVALGAGMRGTELAQRARAARPDLGVLLMSGYSAELLDTPRDAPIEWELLRKPYSRDELAQAMLRALKSRPQGPHGPVTAGSAPPA